MARLWVGGLEVGISERDLEDEVRGCTYCKASKPITLSRSSCCSLQGMAD